MSTTSNYLAVISGGMDSATLLYDLLGQGHGVQAVSFNYGQRHVRELAFAAELAGRNRVQHSIVDISNIGMLLTGSALTDAAVAVPEGHYTDQSMRATVVPNRNAIMLAIASGVAVARGLNGVATAVHAGDHPIYPDCRPGFIDQFNAMQQHAVQGHAADNFRVFAPYIEWTKDEICSRGAVLGVPFALTWSCYQGDARHCGKCGTCVERKEAFDLAGVEDPTEYAA